MNKRADQTDGAGWRENWFRGRPGLGEHTEETPGKQKASSMGVSQEKKGREKRLDAAMTDGLTSGAGLGGKKNQEHLLTLSRAAGTNRSLPLTSRVSWWARGAPPPTRFWDTATGLTLVQGSSGTQVRPYPTGFPFLSCALIHSLMNIVGIAKDREKETECLPLAENGRMRNSMTNCRR